MAKVKIQGNASGTGILTVTAPNTSTDSTITLPDATGTLIADDGSGNVVLDGGDTLLVKETDSTNNAVRIASDINEGFVQLYKDGSQTMQIRGDGKTYLNGGNVGINTSNPSKLLQVKANSNSTTDYPITVLNSAESVTTGYGAYGIDQSASSAYTIDVHDDLVIKSNTGENLRILENGGITFNGDTAAANALDDYEEGTYTPVYGNVSAPSYTVQTGRYTKIGRIVHCSLTITCSSLNTGDGSAFAIGGLPFTANINNEVANASMGRYTSILGSATDGTIHFRLGSSSVLLLDGDNSSLSYSQGSQSGTLTMAFTYEAA